MKQVIRLTSGLTLATSLVLAACAPATPVATTTPSLIQEIGAGEGEVNIIAWAGYIERGETDKSYDWVTDFEAETGCKVNVKVASSSDEMVTLMNQGGFDLVTASGDASLRLIYGNTVQEINTALIQDWARVDPRLQDAPWHTVNGKHYGVPYQWGANVLMYNTEAFGEAPPTSWSVLFEETTLADGQSNKNRVQAYSGPIYMADAALYLKTHQPELGITDPYALNRTQFDATVALLKEQRGLVHRYWPDATAQIDDFTNEGVVAATSWPYQVNTLVAAGQPIASVIPTEGATGWADSTMLHAQAAHPNCAYLWLNHSLEAKVQGDVAAWFGSVPVTPDACTGNALLTDTGCQTNGIESFDQVYFWKTPIADCGNGKTDCVPYSEWVTAYSEIVNSGQ